MRYSFFVSPAAYCKRLPLGSFVRLPPLLSRQGRSSPKKDPLVHENFPQPNGSSPDVAHVCRSPRPVGSTYIPEDVSDSSTDEGVTDEGGDSSHHTAAAGSSAAPAPGPAPAPPATPGASGRQTSADSASTLGSTTHDTQQQQQPQQQQQQQQPAASSTVEDDSAAASCTATTAQQQQQQQQQPKKMGQVAKLWGKTPPQQQQQQQAPPEKSSPSSKKPTEPTVFTPAAVPGAALGAGDAAPRPYWPSNAATATATAAVVSTGAGGGDAARGEPGGEEVSCCARVQGLVKAGGVWGVCVVLCCG